jgi:hypothetical protein
MAKTFSRSLADAIKRVASRTSLDQLKKRGVKNVNLIGLDRIAALIDEAVRSALKDRMMDFETGELGDIADSTKEEFLRLLKSNEELSKSRDQVLQEKAGIESEVDRLRRELEDQQRALNERHAALAREAVIQGAAEAQQLAARIREIFALLPDKSPELARLEEEIILVAVQGMEAEREKNAGARLAERDREVDQLNRRIDKLARSLGQKEQELMRVAAMKSIDPGISSIYRTVQGLSGEESFYDKKREIMADIFAANMRLKQQLESKKQVETA